MCDNDEEIEILNFGEDYNAYEGWYFLRTTAGCYDDFGEVRDNVYEWVNLIFCPVIDGCAFEQEANPVIEM